LKGRLNPPSVARYPLAESAVGGRRTADSGLVEESHYVDAKAFDRGLPRRGPGVGRVQLLSPQYGSQQRAALLRRPRTRGRAGRAGARTVWFCPRGPLSRLRGTVKGQGTTQDRGQAARSPVLRILIVWTRPVLDRPAGFSPSPRPPLMRIAYDLLSCFDPSTPTPRIHRQFFSTVAEKRGLGFTK
jgi:hypothetical protein